MNELINNNISFYYRLEVSLLVANSRENEFASSEHTSTLLKSAVCISFR